MSPGPDEVWGADAPQVAALLQEVLRDFADTVVDQAAVSVAILTRAGEFLLGRVPDADSWRPVDSDLVVLLLVNANVTDVSSPGPEALKVEIASLLQDLVADEGHVAWPPGPAGQILDVALDDRGLAVWHHHRARVAPVGSLRAAE